MKGDSKVLEWLNQVLSIELTSINQYFLHARMFKNWGLSELNEKAYKKSIKDMKQADALIERILFLEGLPNLQRLNRLRIGEHTAEMLQCDLDQIVEQLDVVKDAIAYCESVKDFVTRELLEDIQEYEEEYLDWLETQQSLIAQIGIENYQQSMM
ncbi:MAG: bacterioferritin [Thalassolituus sp.]|jgi:bacterioferritin|uniref:Bacterioferritin n=2 Tax=root TaxID=1 RepID=M5DPK8_9GAMM|nr:MULTISPECIES: bacterioferritin [Thalassolituus]PCI48742.1 MAG: bacterioferritin [Oceanospirillales bacterium]PHQ87459.1 MAG: bacterioferritin [Thalassobium sp.]AHK16395.1 bacterioferritin [Thalassolituus oleivorans R6-15]APR67808.1 bacterioferritin [Thalassolituus oleivorans]MBQ0726161.1 bacterioferritin [Thalassolituus oleivorans]|tara:strand:+ start:33 stop:497 length:465 start_codon:yes stop_codon:yes gene_type:complete